MDTHARNHALAILAARGVLIDTGSFPNTPAGLARALAWVARRTGGDLGVLWVIEGVASYGAGLAAAVEHLGYQVAKPPAPRQRRRPDAAPTRRDPPTLGPHAG